ncbi:HipA family kinase [Gordoniibacillus kamchatkensis]|uniref:HipA family kinase n=1 Tax=Gordoniibacillus kamchatkensis TaxID=1590651 RepID=UPI0006976C92|nr:HipA family kinase [Paenibacillus sp. VKM B-2647]
MWKAKPQGSVWVVKDAGGSRGYFKFAVPEQWHYSGTMVANEIIAAELARKVGIPVVVLEHAELAGPDGVVRRGIVSREAAAREVITWKDASAEVRSRPGKYVKNLGKLRGLVVFDAWIMNMDRATGKNLILYRNSPNEKYNWYLIDHGLTLYGSPYKWEKYPYGSEYWNQLWRYYHVPKGLLRLQSSGVKLEPMLRKIEAVSKADIVSIVDGVPGQFLPVAQRDFIVTMLTDRQKELRGIIQRWLEYKGTKEFGRK